MKLEDVRVGMVVRLTRNYVTAGVRWIEHEAVVKEVTDCTVWVIYYEPWILLTGFSWTDLEKVTE